MTAIEAFGELPDRLLTIEEVAEFLNTTERHVRRLVNERRIPFLKICRKLRFHKAALWRWLNDNHHEVF